MSNWFKHGRTDLKVGFQQSGGICENGHCTCLKEGDQAHGFCGEHDSFGAEYYLMCKECFELYLEARQEDLVECHDCRQGVPRRATKKHIPYFVDEEPRDKWAKLICSDCQEKPFHLARLEKDEEDRSHDQGSQNDWFANDDFDDEQETDVHAGIQASRKSLLDILVDPKCRFLGTTYPQPVIDPNWLLPEKPTINRREMESGVSVARNIITAGVDPGLRHPMFINTPSEHITFFKKDDFPGIQSIVVTRKKPLTGR